MTKLAKLKTQSNITKKEKSFTQKARSIIKSDWQLHVLITLPVLYFFIFSYIPMYGAQIAFKNYSISDGIWGSTWVGFDHFMKFFNSPQFSILIKNTLSISIYALIAGAPFPIILAVMLKYLPFKRYSKVIQSVTFAPHFISIVVMVSIITEMLAPRTGMISNICSLFGINYTLDLMSSSDAFADVYVWSGIWQITGFSAIIYTAILSGIDTSLEEAAMIDGASVWKRIWYIDLPTLIPQFTISLILSLGQILDVGFEKILLMKNDMNARSAQVLATYIYEMGIASALPNVSYTAAIGLFKSLISLVLIFSVNKIVQKLGGTSLW